MGITGILFNVNGRISKNQFWRGIVVLCTISIVVSLLGLIVPLLVATLIGVVSYIVLVWGYIGVYGKRLHDAGFSAWLYLVFFVAYILLGTVTQGFFYGLFGIDITAQMEELAPIMLEEGFGAYFAAVAEYQNEWIYPNIVQMVVLNIALGLIPGFMMGSDPFENVHGEPLQGVADEFE